MNATLLIADDEKTYRSSLANLIQQELPELTVIEAANGLEALRVLEERQVDCMFLDIRMPKMDGMELLGRVGQTRSRDALVVIISGYSDFAYAKTAIQKNIFDYLLKPITPKEALETVGRLLAAVEKKRTAREDYEQLLRTVEQARPQMRLQLFQNLVDGAYSGEQLLRQADFLGIRLRAPYYQCAVMEASAPAEGDAPDFEDTQVRMLRLVESIRSSAGEKIPFEVFQVQSDLVALLFHFQDRPSDSDEWIISLLDRIIASAEADLKLGLVAGIGKAQTELSGVAASYHEARRTLRYKTLLGGGARAYSVTDFGGGSCCDRLDYDNLCMLLKVRNRGALVALLDETLTGSAGTGVSPESLYVFCSKFMVAVFQVLDEYQIDFSRYFLPDRNAFAVPMQLKTVGEIRECLVDLIDFAVDSLNSSYSQNNGRLVEAVKKYVDLHYSQPINNATLAEEMGYSSNYLGQIFRSVTGTSIGEYIRDVRLQRAKHLLAHTFHRVADISDMVGFSNNQYFGTVFKKEVGVTPGEYREMHGGKPQTPGT